MESTAVSLTRTVLDGVLGIAGTAMADEAALLLGVRREVEFIRSELQMMQSFLRVQSSSSAACSAGGCCRDTVRTCVKQVRDLACDLEDCLLDFTLHASRARWLRWGPGLAARHRVADRIRDLKASLVELNQRNKRYNVFVPDIAQPQPAAGVEQRHGRHGHAFDEYQLTHGDERRDNNRRAGEMEHLANLVRREGASVVSVWGMGGMGKSSLARMLYQDRALIDSFDGRAWVTVPHPLDCTGELEGRLRKQLGVEPDMGVPQWMEAKRCLVVVDDVSTHDEWKLISQCLGPNSTGSRVVVTTRREDVARLCAGDMYELKPLGYEEARKLLCQKVYKDPDHTMTQDMLVQANLILKRCRGLPLAIATIGGLLASRPKTSREWINLQEHLGSELESDQDITRVITSSYDGLPYHLKSCFLYLSIFPEKHEIRVTRLLRRWMAEGYITKPRDMTIEEVGRRYYNELISRSMIQSSEKASASMKAEHCRVHGVVLQIILSKSIEENQLFIMNKNSNEAPHTKIRHLVVTRWERNEEKMASINLSQVRSLTVFGECPLSVISSKLRLLRVLDLEDTVGLKDDDLRHIGKLYHLRYLGLRKTDISKLPSSLQNLRYLETLDVQDTNVTRLPVGITKLEKLRYLVGGINFANDLVEKTRKDKDAAKFNCNPFQIVADLASSSRYSRHKGPESKEPPMVASYCAGEFSVTSPGGIEKLRNLQVLGVLHISQGSEVARKLGKLTSLRRLGVDVDENEEVWMDLCSSIAKLAHLERLEVRSESLEFLKESPPQHLVSLRLCGRLGNLPGWVESLHDLAKVKLLRTQLKQVDIEKIGKLPNLTLLALWEESYAEESLRFSKDSFPMLKLLYVEGIEKVETIYMENGALPKLEKLRVSKCLNLHNREEGLSGEIPQCLNELILTSCGDKTQLERALQTKISGLANRPIPTLLTGKSIGKRAQSFNSITSSR